MINTDMTIHITTFQAAFTKKGDIHTFLVVRQLENTEADSNVCIRDLGKGIFSTEYILKYMSTWLMDIVDIIVYEKGFYLNSTLLRVYPHPTKRCAFHYKDLLYSCS